MVHESNRPAMLAKACPPGFLERKRTMSEDLHKCTVSFTHENEGSATTHTTTDTSDNFVWLFACEISEALHTVCSVWEFAVIANILDSLAEEFYVDEDESDAVDDLVKAARKFVAVRENKKKGKEL